MYVGFKNQCVFYLLTYLDHAESVSESESKSAVLISGISSKDFLLQSKPVIAEDYTEELDFESFVQSGDVSILSTAKGVQWKRFFQTLQQQLKK